MEYMNTYLLRLFSLVIGLATTLPSFAQCDDDTTPPIAVCINGLQAMSVPDVGVTIWASDIDEGSYDDCSDVNLEVVLASEDTGTNPGTGSVSLPDISGEYPVVLYVTDESGNFNTCYTTINLIGSDSDCAEDNEAPTLLCNNELVVTLNPSTGSATVYADSFLDEVSDNCDSNPVISVNLLSQSTGQPSGQSAIIFTETGIFTVEAWAVDDFGNISYCTIAVTVQIHDFFNCDPDIVAPAAVCDTETYIAWTQDDLATLQASALNEGSYDFCSETNLTYNIVLGEDDNGLPSGLTELTFDYPGTYSVVMYVIDEANNFNSCYTVVHVEDVGNTCAGETETPVLTCINGLTANLDPFTNQVVIFASDLLHTVTDNCDGNPSLNLNLTTESTGLPQGLSSWAFTETGNYDMELWAIDEAGNFSSCTTFVIIGDPNNNDECDPDETAPIPICFNDFSTELDPSAGATISASDLDVGSFDFCSAVTLSIEQTSEPSDEMPTTESFTVYETGVFPVIVWVADENGNTSQCWTIVSVDGYTYPIAGQVFSDDNDNCFLDGTEDSNGLAGWTIRATNISTGATSTTQTVDDGSYVIGAINDGGANDNDFLIEVILPDGLGTSCYTVVALEEVVDLTTGINFPIKLEEDCDYLTVDVSAPFLRRCFANDYYINYANYSNFPVDDATVSIQLDPFMDFVSANASYIDLGNGAYEFPLGTLPAGFSGQINFVVNISCEAELGATHCVEAMITPFSCIPSESFAELRVTGECDPLEEEVNFTIKNIGDGPMLSPQSHIIIEDVVMYMSAEDPLLLGTGEEASFNFPATGATWRVAIGQDISFPFGGVAAAFVEGCGGFTPGMATQFTINSSKPNVTQDCQENVGSWDPNDKQAFPRGYGEDNFLEANTTINYLIRFQNTGTDTAFNVRIEDQLSEFLDHSSIVPGASSHPYRMELMEDGHLTFYFDNIMLPDSNINQLASNGFVKFQIEQLVDNPIGSRIENTAAIFFDFNEAVITNTVHHTIGENFVLVQTQDVLVPGLELSVAPNPLQTSTRISIKGYDTQQVYCQIYDQYGRFLFQTEFTGGEAVLNRNDFGSNGMYYYRIIDQHQRLVQGKLIVQ